MIKFMKRKEICLKVIVILNFIYIVSLCHRKQFGSCSDLSDMLENEQDSAGETVKIDRFADPQFFFRGGGVGSDKLLFAGRGEAFFR